MPPAPPANSVHPETRKAWRNWLAANHTRKEGVWLITWKKASGKPQLSYDELVEEALCWGWIDSKPNKLDAERTMLWISPRKPKANWSALNKTRIGRAIATGVMTPAGQAKIDAAKADGSWNALDAVDALVIPPDLAAALAAAPPAPANFDQFPKSAKRGILEWIGNAKSAATRSKRLAETASLAALNQRANQWPK